MTFFLTLTNYAMKRFIYTYLLMSVKFIVLHLILSKYNKCSRRQLPELQTSKKVFLGDHMAKQVS